MTTQKRFRELLPPNSNFEFIGRTRLWVLISFLVIGGSIGMLFVNKAWRGDYLNWGIDYKGGTEVIVRYFNKGTAETTKEPTQVDTGAVRSALAKAGYESVDVSAFKWTETDASGTGEVKVEGMKISTPAFGAVLAAEQQRLSEKFKDTFKDREILKGPSWSGDRIFVRSKKPFDWNAVKSFFEAEKHQLKVWPAEEAVRFTTAQEGTGEYNAQFALRGVDAQIEKDLEVELGVDVGVIQTYAVGARAGEKLRNDGIKSMFYAMALIMLYLAVRFDIRYAPGAIVAIFHDAILVIGAFAITWQEVSLTTLAALLTVIGYSVNDTVVIFDRIRENADRLKDKKFGRIINLSINETLSRTLLTSIVLFMVTLAMNVLGTGLVRDFAFAMNVGVVVGVYSTIFIASPIVLAIHNKWYSSTETKSRTRASSNVEAEED